MSLQFRITLLILAAVRWLLYPLFWWKARNPRKILPKINDPILNYSAITLARKIRKKELSSEKVVSAYINRIKAVNPILNAVVDQRYEAALAEAKNVDKYLSDNFYDEEDLKAKKPLFGVPLTVKESNGLEGMSFAVGTKSRLGIKAPADGEAVALLKAAGAIPLAVTNTPELCAYVEARNPITGTTCNPYDTNRTCAGSSGGEGALLGAGASVIGIGSDLGGSIRIPAMFCSVFGHKPSPGLISIKGHFPTSDNKRFYQFSTVGPMTRYSEDLPQMMKILCGENATKLKLDEEVNFSKLNIYVLEDVIHPIQKEIKDATDKCVRYMLETCGTEKKYIDFINLTDCLEMGIIMLFALNAFPNILEDPKNPQNNKKVSTEVIKSIFGCSDISFEVLFHFVLEKLNASTVDKYAETFFEQNEKMKKKFADTLGTSSVLIFPTFPITAFYHGQNRLYTDAVMHTLLFNLAGLPATQVPMGFDNQGLPIGVQIVAGPNQDHLCIAVAKDLEKQFGGWVQPS